MPRYSKRDEVLSRQRTLFGVDMVERQLGDLTELVFRMVDSLPDVSRETLVNTVYYTRAAGWLLTYVDKQRSDFELGGNDGKEI